VLLGALALAAAGLLSTSAAREYCERRPHS
jgi:hypothetical protein